ncbi:MAG: AIR synthase related protein [Patescibacteria group bacterium]|jgi:phosphoribosylformylglycinamidine cyclo-ligase
MVKKKVDGKDAYSNAGVNISAGNLIARMIKESIARAWPEAGEEIGGFAGGGPIPRGARLVKGSCDGAGTKPILAAIFGWLSGIGQDAAAMSGVDGYVAGIRPAYMLDTVKTGHLVPELHIHVVEGVIAACKLIGCKLIGGETAEMPGLYRRDYYLDVDTTTIGFDDPDLAYVPVKVGQLVYAWPSGNLAANGLSLARKVMLLTGNPSDIRKRLERVWPELGSKRLGEVMLDPTPIWISRIEEQRKQGVKFAGHSHTTGGGLIDNPPRMLPPEFRLTLHRNRWTRPAIFPLIQRRGNVSLHDMEWTFNNGLMMLSIVDPDGASINDPDAICVGEIIPRKGNEHQVKFIGRYKDVI